MCLLFFVRILVRMPVRPKRIGQSQALKHEDGQLQLQLGSPVDDNRRIVIARPVPSSVVSDGFARGPDMAQERRGTTSRSGHRVKKYWVVLSCCAHVSYFVRAMIR